MSAFLKKVAEKIGGAIRGIFGFIRSTLSVDGTASGSVNRCMFALGCMSLFFCVVWLTVRDGKLPDLTPVIILFSFLCAIMGIKEFQEFGKGRSNGNNP
jgi:hypothetical protein